MLFALTCSLIILAPLTRCQPVKQTSAELKSSKSISPISGTLSHATAPSTAATSATRGTSRARKDKQLKYPTMFNAMSKLIAKNDNKEAPSSMFRLEPVPGRRDKMLLHIDGEAEPLIVDVPKKDLSVGLPPTPSSQGEGQSSSSAAALYTTEYQRKKARAEKNGKLMDFKKYHRERSQARYYQAKSKGLPTHKYRKVAAKIRKNILLENNPAIVQQRLEQKRLRDRKSKKKMRSDPNRKEKEKVFASEEERLEWIAKRKTQMREASRRYLQKKRQARAESALKAVAETGEPSNAVSVANVLGSSPYHQAANRDSDHTLPHTDPMQVDVESTNESAKENRIKMLDLNEVPSDGSEGIIHPVS